MSNIKSITIDDSVYAIEDEIARKTADECKERLDNMTPSGVEISKEQGNIIVSKADGLYASSQGADISKETNNSIEKKTDGLYVEGFTNKNILSKLSDEDGNLLYDGKEISSGKPFTESVILSDDTDKTKFFANLSTSSLYYYSNTKGDWIELSKDIHISKTAPENTKLVWIDTSEESKVKIKVYISEQWVSIGGDEIKISKESGNILQNKADGLYVSAPSSSANVSFNKCEW